MAKNLLTSRKTVNLGAVSVALRKVLTYEAEESLWIAKLAVSPQVVVTGMNAHQRLPCFGMAVNSLFNGSRITSPRISLSAAMLSAVIHVHRLRLVPFPSKLSCLTVLLHLMKLC